jgi:hypothetical protein
MFPIKIKIILVCLWCLIVFFAGCASGPQFIPEQLEQHPINELSELNINGRVKNIYIDGNSAGIGIVYLKPGNHTITYEAYEETETWRGLVKSMNEKGFYLSRDGETFVRSQGGYSTTARPLGVSRFGWQKKSKKIGLDAGKKYWLSRLR